MTNSSDKTSSLSRTPLLLVVIKQGGIAIGLVLAALIVTGVATYSINVWSTTRKETSPGLKLQKGLEKLQNAAQKKLESAK